MIKLRYGNTNTFLFEHAGLADGGRKDQLQAFTASLKRAGLRVDDAPANWLDAFKGGHVFRKITGGYNSR